MKRWPFGVFKNFEDRFESKFKLTVEPEPTDKGDGGEDDDDKVVNLKIGGKDVSPADAEAAINLYKAMQDPETSQLIIENLAAKAGFVKNGAITEKGGKTEDKLEGRIHKLMKSKLGKDYEKFSDVIGPLLDEGIAEYVAELKEGIEERSSAGGWQGEVEKFTETHTLTDEVEGKMEELIKRNGGIPKGLKGKAAQEYLTDHYEMAVRKLGIEPPKRKSSRDRSAIDEIPEFREIARPKNPSLDQIIEDSMKGIRYRT